MVDSELELELVKRYFFVLVEFDGIGQFGMPECFLEVVDVWIHEFNELFIINFIPESKAIRLCSNWNLETSFAHLITSLHSISLYEGNLIDSDEFSEHLFNQIEGI